MIKRTIVHVGLHKTGTTSLQRSFHLPKNNATLQEAGLLYPRSWPENHSIPVYSMFSDKPETYHIHRSAGRGVNEIEELNARYQSELASEVALSTCSDLLISGEDISVLSKEGLRAFRHFINSLCGNNLEVVVVIRHPVDWAISSMQEAIKHGTTYSEGLTHAIKAVGAIPDRLHGLTDVFGPAKLRVVQFEHAVSDPEGYLIHFLRSVGYSTLPQLRLVRANESLSDLAASVVAYCHERRAAYGDWLSVHDPDWIADRNVLAALPGRKFDVSVEERASVLEAAIPTIDYFEETFGISYPVIDTVAMPTPQHRDPSIGTLLDITPRLSPTTQSLVIDYLATRTQREMQVDLAPDLLHTIGRIGERPGRLAAEQLLRTQWGARSTLPRAEFYRDIALFLETTGQIDAAHSMMQMAAVLRPHGPLIRDKVSDYERELAQCSRPRRRLHRLSERRSQIAAVGRRCVSRLWSKVSKHEAPRTR